MPPRKWWCCGVCCAVLVRFNKTQVRSSCICAADLCQDGRPGDPKKAGLAIVEQVFRGKVMKGVPLLIYCLFTCLGLWLWPGVMLCWDMHFLLHHGRQLMRACVPCYLGAVCERSSLHTGSLDTWCVCEHCCICCVCGDMIHAVALVKRPFSHRNDALDQFASCLYHGYVCAVDILEPGMRHALACSHHQNG